MSTAVGLGQRRVLVSPEAIEAWLVKGKPIKTNLPNDARLLRLFPEETGDCYVLVFESEEWDELAEGEEIPKMTIEVQENPITFKIQ